MEGERPPARDGRARQNLRGAQEIEQPFPGGAARRLNRLDTMPHLVKVADLNELPPGKGKTLKIDGRDITVYNREGRFVATATMPRHLTGLVDTTTCGMPGHTFEIGIGDSPDRLQSDELRYQVVVEGVEVFVVLED